MTQVDVSIIVVSYNTRELTLACLESVYKETRGIDFEVIVVDNASKDGSARAVAKRFPGALVIPLEENVGFARANNLAAERARGEYVLLLNPDTVVLDGAVQKLLAFARARPEAGIFGGRTVFADGSLNPLSCRRRPTWWSLFCLAAGLTALFRGSALFDPESYGAWRRDSERRVDIVTGCFLLARRDLWRRLGGFDERYFMYGEEVDFCLRAGKAGEACLFTPEATIVHYGGASEPAAASKLCRLLAGKATNIRRHWKRGASWFGIAMLRLWVLRRCLAARLASLAPAAGSAGGAGVEEMKKIWEARGEWSKGYEA